MAIRTKTAKRKLSSKDQRHLTEDCNINSVDELLVSLRKSDRKCPKCIVIANKLGLKT